MRMSSPIHCAPLVVGLALLSSCGIYKGQLDCPPKRGVRCKSVSEIEAMIVECPEGADLFIPPGHCKQKACKKHCRSKLKKQCVAIERHSQPITSLPRASNTKRVWIHEHTAPNGDHVLPHYIEINDDRKGGE